MKPRCNLYLRRVADRKSGNRLSPKIAIAPEP
jgi:hypothetical protein